MKFTRTLALLVSTALLVAACGKDATETAVTQQNSNPLLAYAPADTPLVVASLEPVPKDITDAYVERFQPVIDEVNKAIAQFQADYANGTYGDDPKALFASVMIEELGGSLSLENLEKLGISPQSNQVVYTMGVFPVIRIELTDASALSAAISRIESKMGLSLPVRELNETNYWRMADPDSPMGVYISILDKQLALGMFPVNAEDQFLAAFLGQEMPQSSIASTNALANLNKEKGYTPYGSGIVDIEKLADEFFNSDSETRALLGAEMSQYFNSLDAVCVSEMKAMISQAPRMVMGTTSMTADEISASYELEMANPLAASLAALVTDVPPASEGNFLVSASLALQVGKLRNFILEKANEIVATPYQCGHFQEINTNAQQLVQQMNIPMPPMVNNLEGIRIRLDDIDPSKGFNQGNGLVALHVDKPEMFVGMANMMVPGFDSLDLANQTEPVKLPETLVQMPNLDVFALMGKRSIGAAVGEQHAADLKSFMNVNTKNEGTFFSVSYDMARQMELQESLTDLSGMDTSHVDTAALYYAENVRKAYMEILGRSRVDMSFTNDGLVIDSKFTFK